MLSGFNSVISFSCSNIVSFCEKKIFLFCEYICLLREKREKKGKVNYIFLEIVSRHFCDDKETKCVQLI